MSVVGRNRLEQDSLVRALAQVKQTAARANRDLARLPEPTASAIDTACQRIIEGMHHDAFVV